MAVARAGGAVRLWRISAIPSRAARLVKNGVPENKLMAKLKTDDLGWRLSFTGERLDHLYSELSRTK